MKLFLITMFTFVGCTAAQQTTTYKTLSSKDAQPDVTLCDMVANPEIYNGKRVKVSATLLAGIEDAAVFVDDYCRPALEKSTQIIADFKQKEYPSKSPVAKKLTQILRKSQQAEVTVVGVFTAPSRDTSHCGYGKCKLEVQRLLSAQTARHDK